MGPPMIVDAPGHRLERYFLRPLSAAALMGTVAFSFQRSWGAAAILLLTVLGIGAAGAALHPGKSFSELATAPTPHISEALASSAIRIVEFEGIVTKASAWAVLSLVVVMRHFDFRWFLWLPGALVAYVLLTFLGGLVARGNSARPFDISPPSA